MMQYLSFGRCEVLDLSIAETWKREVNYLGISAKESSSILSANLSSETQTLDRKYIADNKYKGKTKSFRYLPHTIL